MNINIRTSFNVRSSVRKIFEKIRRRFSAIKRRYCESFKNEKNIFRDVTAPLLDVCVYLIFIARFFPAQECSRMCELGRSICFFVSRFKRSCFFPLRALDGTAQRRDSQGESNGNERRRILFVIVDRLLAEIALYENFTFSRERISVVSLEYWKNNQSVIVTRRI